MFSSSGKVLKSVTHKCNKFSNIMLNAEEEKRHYENFYCILPMPFNGKRFKTEFLKWLPYWCLFLCIIKIYLS